MAIVMLRHGRVPPGTANAPLSPAGERDIHAATARLAHLPIVDILTSPETRAVETAHIWGKAAGVPVTVDRALDSWDLGAFKGKHSGAADAVVKRLLDHPTQPPPGGGESAHAYWGRLLPAVLPLIADDQLHGVVNHSRGLKSVEALVAAQGQGMDRATWDGPLAKPGEALMVSKDGVQAV